jgi:hypothetical protein
MIFLRSPAIACPRLPVPAIAAEHGHEDKEKRLIERTGLGRGGMRRR